MASNSTPDPVLGALLDGRYQVSKLLGKGGMGSVYLAEDTRLRRRCALKVLHPDLAADRTHVERFLREAQTIAQLGHPNIVDIYAYGEEASGVVWFAMELLLGDDLDARVKARAERPFTTHECCAWGVQIARAVAVVHDAGLIHRDLKTSNIFLAQRRDGEEIIKLLDFGIARPVEGSELTATGVALGTPSYMSPEQVRNTTVDRRSDVYSFGVLLFKLLTNRVPFSGDPIQVAMAQCTQPAPLPSQVAPDADISPELDALVLRAMAKAPDDRYQSMREIEDALAAILHAEAPELAPAARPGRIATSPAVRPRANSAAQPAAVLAASTPPASPSSDHATHPTAAQTTGPTAALQTSNRARSDRWLFITTGVSLLSVAVVLGIYMLSDGSAPPPVPGPPVEPVNPPSVAIAPTTPTREPPAALEPIVTPPPTAPAPPPPPPTDTPPEVKSPVAPKPKPRPPATPEDPFKQIERKAQACRRTHKQVGGPKITIDYAVSMTGKATRSIPSVDDELGKCLAAVISGTQFEAKVMLGQKISL